MTKPAAVLDVVTDDAPEPVRPRRSVGRRIAIIAYSVFVGLVILALIAASVVVFSIQRSFPQLDGEKTLSGLTADVTVQRDELGIPTITAETSHDLFYAQGYVHAQDRFWEMDFRRHVTSGRLSELFGESQLETDIFLRTLGWREVAAQEVDSLDPTVRAYYDAYAEGVNAYLADHDGSAASFEYAVLGLQNPDYEIEPWTPEDSVAWLKAMAWDLRTNIGDETDRAVAAASLSPEQLTELFPTYPFEENPVIVPVLSEAGTPVAASASTAGETETTIEAAIDWTEVGDVVEAVSTLVGPAGEGIGSNSWVVSGALTESGMPLLANDPHLGASLPSVWHQVQLKCARIARDCPFDVAGFSFSGMPGVVIGHNADIAWGFTNLTTDVTDLYLERVQGDEYWRDGQLLPLQTRSETIRVAGGDDVEITVRATENGPLISDASGEYAGIAENPYVGTEGVPVVPDNAPDGEYAVSLRWTALEPGTTAAALFAMNQASDFDSFRTAASLFDVPAQNLVYADVEGNIGYQTPGRLPIRGAGDGSLPQPGWDSAYAWQGYIPFEELPVSLNPDSGYIVTANNAIVGEDYPYQLTRDWDYGWRAARITEMIERRIAAGPLTAADMRDIQADNTMAIGSRLIAAYSDIRTGDDGPDAALDLLAGWDAQNSDGSAAAAYANVLWDELVQNLFVRERDAAAPTGDQGRMFLVVETLLADPSSPWWENSGLGVSGQQEMLERTAADAYDRLVALQGDNPARWDWGDLHALTLRSDTFGSSGIAPIEMLFNRGPYPVGGGSSVANATGWVLGEGFETVTVPSMRMVIDLADFDRSGWQQLTGTSGHAFHPNYVDQTGAWQRVELYPWAFTPEAVDAAATHTLILRTGG
jgi:penicillin amidase